MPAPLPILVVNCGSSSLKYCLLDMRDEQLLASGLLERIGEVESHHLHRQRRADGSLSSETHKLCVADHGAAIDQVFQRLGNDLKLHAIGHRVVHGGATFQQPARLNAVSLCDIRRTVPLAPLHNPINLVGIEACLARFPDLPQVAVFDTAFHQSMPEVAWRYALPESWQVEHGVRRYGFHGTSCAYVSQQAADWLGRPLQQCNLIVLHLGNGASATAIRHGRSVDTSMGLTPLEGLVMGTRCGDMDPAIPAYMERVIGLSPEQVDDLLNKHSGLKALCGDYDMRILLARAAQGDEPARLALDIYAYRIRKYIGAYTAVLGRVDALIFTGGVGEHAAPVRARICADLDHLGIRLDEAANAEPTSQICAIHRPDSPVRVLVIPTNEELQIARQTLASVLN